MLRHPKTKIINEEKIRHSENYSAQKVNVIGVISFLIGFTQATIIYIMSSYFKLATGSENVGLFYFLAYAVVMIALLNLHKIVRIIGKSNTFYLSLLFKITSIAVLMICPSTFWTIIPLMFFLIFSGLEWASLDVLLESFSEDKKSGRIRGKHLTLINAGFVFGPFLAMELLDHFDFSGIFIFIFVINSIVLVVSLISLRRVNHRFNGQVSIVDLVKKAYFRRNIMRIYYISFVLEFFYAIMVVYSPIYLRDLGFSWDKIGIIFTVMLVPFVLLQYPMGVLADKKTGEKEAIIASLIILGASSGIVYFISTPSVFVWSVVLFATRIGAALVEVLRDSYFYKRIDSSDVDLINFFRTALPMGYIAASLISLLLLIFLPLKSIFLVLAAVVFSALLPGIYLLDSKSEKEIVFKK